MHIFESKFHQNMDLIIPILAASLNLRMSQKLEPMKILSKLGEVLVILFKYRFEFASLHQKKVTNSKNELLNSSTNKNTQKVFEIVICLFNVCCKFQNLWRFVYFIKTGEVLSSCSLVVLPTFISSRSLNI